MARAFKGVLNMTTKKKKSEFAKLPAGDKVLMLIAYAILGLFLIAIILPVIYIFAAFKTQQARSAAEEAPEEEAAE